MNQVLIIAAIAVVLVVVIVRRFTGEPLNARDLFVPPVVLLGIGVLTMTKEHFSALDLTWIVVSGLIGLALGALRGTTITLLTRDGVLWQRYTVWTVGVWLLSLGTSTVAGMIGSYLGAHQDLRPVQLSIGVSLLGEALVIGGRALSTGYPFAPEKTQRTNSPLLPIAEKGKFRIGR
ncbi:hypothetical protein ACFXHA_14965 [Nocardia sp. NPDC059240]|uniref:hypothetical protein n=1 Tax=Nocardia sp. NPDC059240 TaxID=3346786 RepID=UPI0036834C28